MLIASSNPKNLSRPVVHSGVVTIATHWINHLEIYAEPVEELMKLTRNKRHFYRHGRAGCNQAKAWFIATFVTPPEITKTF